MLSFCRDRSGTVDACRLFLLCLLISYCDNPTRQTAIIHRCSTETSKDRDAVSNLPALHMSTAAVYSLEVRMTSQRSNQRNQSAINRRRQFPGLEFHHRQPCCGSSPVYIHSQSLSGPSDNLSCDARVSALLRMPNSFGDFGRRAVRFWYAQDQGRTEATWTPNRTPASSDFPQACGKLAAGKLRCHCNFCKNPVRFLQFLLTQVSFLANAPPLALYTSVCRHTPCGARCHRPDRSLHVLG